MSHPLDELINTRSAHTNMVFVHRYFLDMIEWTHDDKSTALGACVSDAHLDLLIQKCNVTVDDFMGRDPFYMVIHACKPGLKKYLSLAIEAVKKSGNGKSHLVH